jgi:hypothetical protein
MTLVLGLMFVVGLWVKKRADVNETGLDSACRGHHFPLNI